MGPGSSIRKVSRFAGLGAAVLTASPSLAQELARSLAQDTAIASMPSISPLVAAFGIGACALVALAAIRHLQADAGVRARRAAEQVSGLRALLDEYEGLLTGSRELTVLWRGPSSEPKLLGEPRAVLPAGRRADAVLKFSAWLIPDDAERLARLTEALRVDGRAFETGLSAIDGRLVRAAGWAVGGGAALRLRPVMAAPEPARTDSAKPPADAEMSDVRTILALLSKPAFMRDAAGRLIFANTAYQRLAQSLGRSGTGTAPAELVDPDILAEHAQALRSGPGPCSLPLAFEGHGRFELVEFAIDGGTAGYLRPAGAVEPAPADPGLAHIAGIIDALATPIAIFDASKQLVQSNRAYAELWGLSGDLLIPGTDERAILDRLRTEGQLPAVPDYHGWRSQHLSAYGLKVPREDEPWHLPDGRSIKVIAAPAGPKGGVIYVFEDITERLELESINKALSSVQRESLNALAEAVAVFGTNGRLTLFNPRLAALWKLDMGRLGGNPHIDRIAEACGESMPQDGQAIWRDLKRGIIDLNPTRTDTTGRIARADGRLLDYAITRLPDGQTMMSFLDVTESAKYSQVLKERNEALVAADQLKDAFIQNVSYELRSPLTNIIGFADLLAADGSTLSDRQKAYTDYIRASSTTLGVLIDNILDLANVDAGIAELKPERLDVGAIIDKARAGLSATFPEISGEKPINLVVDVPDDLPEFHADATRMVQILYNLLSNAARFSPPGGEIRLSVEARADRLLFVVEDEGPGLTDEMRQAIDARIAPPTGGGRLRGAGLGLAIVRTFVNLHAGIISAEKREPRGSRIIVNLPRDTALAGVGE